MTEITIEQPIKLRFEVIESDDMLPSIKMQIDAEIIYPT